MKKIYIIFAIVLMFVLQLGVGTTVKAADNVSLDEEKYSNMETEYISCGDNLIKGMPKIVPRIVKIAYNVLQIAAPVILVVMGMITLVKAVSAGKEDEIKKAQMTFVKKLITGAIVFFVFVIVKLLVSVAADSNKAGKIMDCTDCFLNGKNCVKSK